MTGSGKTEIYLQGIAHALTKGQTAIVLVPEISLTPQTVERFKARFSSGEVKTLVAVLHSHLADGEQLRLRQAQRDARVMQLVFFGMSEATAEGYRGRYQGENIANYENAAFDKLPKGTVEGLLKPEKKADLTKVLRRMRAAAQVGPGLLLHVRHDHQAPLEPLGPVCREQPDRVVEDAVVLDAPWLQPLVRAAVVPAGGEAPDEVAADEPVLRRALAVGRAR